MPNEIELVELIEEYIAQLSLEQKIAYDIAVKQLQTSFDISKSIGFIKFNNDKK